MKKEITLKMCLAAMFLALGLVLPFITAQIPEIGNMFLPMHLPILICGFVCGWKYGLVIGFITPLIRFVLFGMPQIYPMGLAMAFELGTYGAFCGLIHSLLKNRFNIKFIVNVYITLVISMIFGRIVWGLVRYLLAFIDGSLVFSFQMFLLGAFITAWPGIILQLILIPAVLITLEKMNLIK